MALEFLKNKIILLMQERDKAITRADDLLDTVQEKSELVTQVSFVIKYCLVLLTVSSVVLLTYLVICTVFQLENEKRDLVSRLALADSELDSLHEQKDCMANEKSELEVEVEKLRRENDSLQNAIDTFETAFEYKEKEIEDLQQQIENFNLEMDELLQPQQGCIRP
eukprot:sb/3472518/